MITSMLLNNDSILYTVSSSWNEFSEENTSANASYGPPEFQTSDYGEIVVLAVLVMVGGPLNLVSLLRTMRVAGYFDRRAFNACCPWRSKWDRSTGNRRSSRPAVSGKGNKSASRSARTNPRLLTFKLHLTSANLLIVFGYGISQLGWLCTYSWRGGDALCKFTKFLHTFCFYATSNLVAAIAVDRLHVTINVDRPPTNANGHRFSNFPFFPSLQAAWLQRLVWSAWTIAFASSTPQFFIWRTFAPFPDWHQCVTVWLAAAHTDHDQDLAHDGMSYARIYDAVHLSLVFWIPASVIVLCYAMVLAQLRKRIKRSKQDLRHLCMNRRESDAVVFRQQCENLHRASICSVGSLSGGRESSSWPNPSSPALLMELPIVINSAQPFLFPKVPKSTESFAVVTLTKAKRNTMKKTVWIILAYVVCWSPYEILELYRYLIDPEFDNAYLQFLSNLIVFNAVVNPLIYGF